MEPVGASAGRGWQPSRTSDVEIDGARLPLVPGGSHGGGGLGIGIRAHARFGRVLASVVR